LFIFPGRWSIKSFITFLITFDAGSFYIIFELSTTIAIMHSSSVIPFLFLLASAQASVLSTTNIATVLAGATSQSSLTIPADAMAAIAKLGTGGATASTLSAADKAAISSCTSTAQANNTASKANLGGGTGSAGNIACKQPFSFLFFWRLL
jgi:hypothetical protein